MDELASPLCFLRMVWRSLKVGHWTSGHKFVVSKDETPENVQVLECETCGHHSVAWSWEKI